MRSGVNRHLTAAHWASFFFFFFFFFFQLYNCLWVFACSVISFHFFLSCVVCLYLPFLVLLLLIFASSFFFFFFFFFFQLYNSLWVLTCSIISFHFFLSCVVCFQLFTPIFFKSFLTSSSHLTLDLPFGLVAYGFNLCMVLATLSLVLLSTCPNQFSGLCFMYLNIFSLLIASSNSSFVLSLHSPFAFCVGPNIFLNIFLYNTYNLCLMFSVKTQHLYPYTTTGSIIRCVYYSVICISRYS